MPTNHPNSYLITLFCTLQHRDGKIPCSADRFFIIFRLFPCIVARIFTIEPYRADQSVYPSLFAIAFDAICQKWFSIRHCLNARKYISNICDGQTRFNFLESRFESKSKRNSRNECSMGWVMSHVQCTANNNVHEFFFSANLEFSKAIELNVPHIEREMLLIWFRIAVQFEGILEERKTNDWEEELLGWLNRKNTLSIRIYHSMKK